MISSFASPVLQQSSSLNVHLDVLPVEKTRLRRVVSAVCSNPPPFYKIKGLLPSVDSRKQVLPISS
jgi:hypothetical protein